MSNLSYEEISFIVEDLVRIKSRKFARRHLSSDDIAQEIRLKCWHAMTSYSSERGQSLKTYLNVCTENHLLNLIRDTFGTFNPPEKHNPKFFSSNGVPTQAALEDPKIAGYIKRFNKKRLVILPSPLSSEITADKAVLTDGNVKSQELDLTIRQAIERIDPTMIPYYEDIIEGKEVPKKIKLHIQSIVASILE